MLIKTQFGDFSSPQSNTSNSSTYPNRYWVQNDRGKWFSVDMTDEERVTLRQLRSMGIELEVDDE